MANNKKTGYIVEYTDLQGQKCRGHVYHSEQTAAFREQNKLVIRKVNKDDKVEVKNGRAVTAIKDVNEVKQLCFLN